MRIVIVGDIHGKLNLMYEKASSLNPDVILQLGDASIFEDVTKKMGLQKGTIIQMIF